MGKHTKGDWFVSGGSQIVSMPSQCKISNNISGWNPAEAEANAQLIAAAPNLLEACKHAVDLLYSADFESGPTYDKVKAAIAKAEGK